MCGIGYGDINHVLERAWFAQLEPHLLDCDPLDNHIYKLSKMVAEYYLKVRLHHITKETNLANCKGRVRTMLSRLIIFKNQCAMSVQQGSNELVAWAV